MTKILSIITINLNNAKGLKHTLESVIPQLTSACEYIVIDGDSTDGSQEIIRANENFITYWISEKKGGIYKDMNKGILRATGDYCLFLNSGDRLIENVLPDALAECLGEEIIYFNTCLSYGNDRFEELKYPEQLTMRSFFSRTINHQSTLIKRDLFKKFGMYNEDNTIHSDYEFWIKSIIVNNCTCKYVDFPLAYYDMGGRSSKPTEKTLLEIDAILSRYIPKRILADYEYWNQKEKEMTVLVWYKENIYLYRILVFFYKVIKNVKKTLRSK